jgi:TetR/AcrR family transcriptional regulator, transcriptional repressor for nem operon
MSNVMATKKARKPKKKLPATREVSKEASRAALVEAALALFAKEGLDRPSLDAICDKAGYTRGAFYVHFGDREDLLVAVMERVGAEFLQSLFVDLAPVVGVPEEGAAGSRFVRAARRFIGAIEAGRYPLMGKTGDAPMVRPHQLLAACARSPRVADHYRMLVRTSVEAVGALLAADQAEGGIRQDIPADELALFAHAVVVGAQTMNDLGVDVSPAALERTFEAMIATSRGGAASR